MTKTIKTVLAVIGALTAICGVLLLLKKLGLIKVCCKKCGKEKCECDKPETVEDFVEEAVEDKVKEVKEAVEEGRISAERYNSYLGMLEEDQKFR